MTDDDDVIVLDWRLVWERIAMLAQHTTAEGSAGRSASLVLVVQDEPFERALTARHLRNAGLDVIEVASEDQARRVLDAVHVDIVFADLETSGQANEFSLLRLLYEHHPGAKTIITSGAETDMAAAEGYGIFLRKPLRLVDLDSSIQRILDANVSVSPANGTIWADTGTGSRREALKQRRAADSADNVLDEVTKQRLAELSRQLAERGARQIAVDPEVATAARRDALKTYDRARSRRLRLMLGFALGAVLGSGVTKLPGMLGLSPSAASIEQALAVETVAMMSTPVAPELRPPSTAQSSPLPRGVMSSAEPTNNQRPNSEPILDPPGSPLPPDGPGSFGSSREASNRAGSATQSAVVEATPSQVPLERNEIQEVQKRLRSFGFNPGPIDGAVGTKTAEAVIKYQQARGQLQTGTVNRELLEQLRQDAAQTDNDTVRSLSKPRFQVVDGDTVKFGSQLVTLFGIDAPEKEQTCDEGRWHPGPLAKKALEDFIAGRPVNCRQIDYDAQNGHAVAQCYAGDDDLQALMVSAGWAWSFGRYSSRYGPEEQDAVVRKAGVHGHRCLPAWEWRALHPVKR